MGFFIPLVLITAVVVGGTQMVVSLIAERAGGAGASLNILVTILQALVSMGWINIMLKYTRGENAEYGDLFQPISQFLSFLVAYVIYGVAVVVGMIFLVIPGLILGLRLQFAPFFVVDQQCGPIEALGKSWNATRGSTWKLLGLGIVLGLVNMVGALLLLVGLIATGPTTAIALTDVYTKLRDSA
jgi:uncharacterized membrane protein